MVIFKDVLINRLSLPFIISIFLLDIDIPGDFKFGNLSLFLISIVVLFFYMFSNLNKYKCDLTDYIFLLYVMFAVSSAFWSPNFIDTIFHGSLWLVIIYGCRGLAFSSKIKVLRYVIYVAIILCILSLLVIPIFPNYAWQSHSSTGIPELKGVFFHQLRLGVFSGIILGMLIISSLNGDFYKIFPKCNSKKLPICLILFFLFILFMSQARLYTLFFILSLLVNIIIDRLNKPIDKMFAIFCLVILVVFVTNWNYIFNELDMMGVDATLTGRTLIWERTLDIINNSNVFFTGFGYPSFDSPQFDIEWPWYRPAHPHNSFIQVYFELGVLGLLIIISFVVFSFKEIFISKKNKFSYSGFLYIYTLLGSLTGSNFGGKPSVLFVLFYFIFLIEKSERSSRGAHESK
jgi:exopolysaccharide production protein ExoQ